FIGTFIYSLWQLTWVDRNDSDKVPMVSVVLVLVLLVITMIIFARLIQRISDLQISNVLETIGDRGREVLDQMFKRLDQEAGGKAPPVRPSREQLGPATQTVVYRGEPRAIAELDIRRLVRTAQQAGATVVMARAVGDTLFNGNVLLHVHGGTKIDESELLRSVQVLPERTFEQDPKYALRLLADIAIKALSPAVNDPTTAVQALDHIQDQLMRLGSRRLEIGAFRDVDGTLRLSIPHPTCDDFLALGLGEIRYYGGTSVQVMRRMSALITDLIAALPPERLPGLHHQRRRLAQLIARSFADDEGKTEAQVEDRQGLGASHRG